MSSKSRRPPVDNYDDDVGSYEQEDSDVETGRHYHSQSYSRSYLGEGTRSLQRPNSAHHSGTRLRKTSGSSPWDGEGDEASVPTGKPTAWNRPSSASESASIDRRRFYSSQILVGSSDNEKDRRLRLKSRGSSSSSTAQLTTPRSVNAHRGRHENEFYFEDTSSVNVGIGASDSNDRLSASGVGGENFYSPSSSIKSPRGFDDRQSGSAKRKAQIAQSSRKTGRGDGGHYAEIEEQRFRSPHSPNVTRKSNLRGSRKEPRRSALKVGGSNYEDEAEVEDEENYPGTGDRYNFEDEEGYPKEQRFNYEFEEQAFESDFIANSPKVQPKGKSSFRFSNDFSNSNFDADFERSPVPQKLRFNDKIKVSKFKTNFGEDEPPEDEPVDNSDMFEDDFSKVTLTSEELEAMDQWNEELPVRRGPKPNNTGEISADNIRKSESVNIFAKKYEDPFEDDDFFNATNENGDSKVKPPPPDPFNWDNNFAKFDDNNV